MSEVKKVRETPLAPSEAALRSAVMAATMVFVPLAALYACMACTTVGPGDSGALTVAMTTWGVPHAPGYPLLCLIGNLATHLVRVSEPALVLNLLNACFAAAACATLAVAVIVVTRNPWAGIVGGLALGVSRIFWLQALAIEVLSFNAWMAALLLVLLCLAWRSRGPRPALWTVPIAVLIATTAITHHLTLVLVAGPVALGLLVHFRSLVSSRGGFRRLAPIAKWTGVALAIGLLPLLYIPIAAAHDPALNWGDVHDLASFTRHLARRDFGSGTLTSPGLAASQVLMHGESASPLGQRNFIALWKDLPHSLGWGLLVLAVVGTVDGIRRNRALLVVLATFLAAIALFFARVNTPILPFYACVTERFFILPHLVFAFLGGLGAAAVIDSSSRFRWPGAAVAIAVMIVTILPTAIVHGPHVNQRGNTFTRDLGSNLMAGMPSRAIFFSTGDMFRNSFLYQRECLGHRRDVSLVDEDLMVLPWYVGQLRRRGTLRLPEGMTATVADSSTGSRAWIDFNADAGDTRPGRPAVAVKLVDDTSLDRYRLEARGLWSRVVPRRAPVDLVRWEREYSAIARQWTVRSLERRYPDASWEASDEVFYPFALGELLGLRDLVGIVRPALADDDTIPALRDTERWPGKLRADLAAYRADFLCQSLQDAQVGLDAAADSAVAARAMSLARNALDLDPSNDQALRSLILLLSRRGERREELQLRERLLDLRPGDFEQITAYLRLAVAELRSSPSRAELAARAESVRGRFLRLLEIANRIAPDPQFVALREHWSMPLDEIPELR